MGIAERQYMRGAPGHIDWSATLVLIAALVVAFLFQIALVSRVFADHYLALSLEGLKHGFVWQLLTFQFLHGGLVHLLLNCWAIYVFGRVVEAMMGISRFLILYFLSGVIGGLLQMLGAWLWPGHFGGAVVGASAGAFGLVAAFGVMNPRQELTMLLFFILPMRMRARTLVFASLVLSGLGIVFPDSIFGGHVAHAAHLGGLLVGIAWIKLDWHRDYVSLPWEGLFDRWRRSRRSQTRTPQRELVKVTSLIRRSATHSRAVSTSELPSEEFISREVDPILEKISAHGIQSLTDRERQILEVARTKMGKR